jgi:CSLREA domain-containing protein
MRHSIRPFDVRRALLGAAAMALGLAVPVGAAGAARVAPATAVRSHASVHVARPTAAAMLQAAARRHAVANRRAPRVVGAAATFVVTSLADSPLANPTGTTCHDSESSHPCSLRAGVQAANNLGKPVTIKLGAHTYSLTNTGLGSLVVENAGGTTIDGVSEAATKIKVPSGDLYGVLQVLQTTGHKGSTVFLNDLTLTGGSSAYGAGLYEDDATDIAAVLDHVSITGNTATYPGSGGQGGGVWMEYGSLWATDSSISGNTAMYEGGALWVYWGYVYLLRTSVNSDVATNATFSTYGGGIFSDYGDVHVVGGSVSNDRAGNATESGEGGGIYDQYGTTFLSGNVQVNHDTVQDNGEGGADFEEYSALNVAGATFGYDQALGGTGAEGGAISIDYMANATIAGATFTHDSTSASVLGNGGGAIYVYGYRYSGLLTVASSTFTADGTTAVVFYAFDGGSSAVFTGCRFQGDRSAIPGTAGAIFAYVNEYGGLSIKVERSKLLGNTSSGAGGAGGILVYSEDYSGSTLVMTGDIVNGNVATGYEGTGGVVGNAVNESSVTMDVTGSTFSANRSPNGGYGGAVSSTSNDTYINSTLRLVGDHFSANTAGSGVSSEEGYGGAVFAYNYTELQTSGCTFTGNVAAGNGSNGGYGGAVYDGSYGGTTYVGDTFTSNRATGHNSEGGGLYLYPYEGGALVAQTTVRGNAASYGGGIYVTDYTLDVVNSTIVGNTAGSTHAAGEGGGMFVTDDALSVTNSTLAGNLAMSGGGSKGQGGAVYFDEGGSQAYFFDTISGNAAAQGGGLYVYQGGTLRGTVLTGNHATLHGGAETDCFFPGPKLVSAGGNVLRTGACVTTATAGDVVTAQPRLGPLANNGGPTMTMALLAHSPAIGVVATGCTPTDQRGAHRPTAKCDAGSFEHP